ncbi:Hsp33 family molecular chaperone HslO [Acidaminobacter sp. JC074]|uniref:Hsp33 family molecular chaperone HslO n=1 Tax=Acidaminobacter sp. JC074 TaxID=2530199 RepID=UPI001F0F4138|nr:Hsp33 family molecular chaperone HslO [Acidaminobacter sp. JC074]MCH4889507.1 Hsp33 family molecular chaperone HslO [Acidaminobacter sp. JC074]
MSKIYSAIVGDNIRVYLGNTTDLVKEAAKIHETSPVSTEALSRTLTATSLLGKLLKNEKDVLTVKVGGTNQIKTILATTDFTGKVKGYISNPDADIPYLTNTDKIADAIGKGGNITIIRDFGLKEPYVGISHMISAEIDEDIAFYYKNSEQQPTAMKLGTIMDNGLECAGGILIQPMPDVTGVEKEAYLKASEKIGDVVDKINSGMSPEEIIASYFDLDVKMTGEFEVSFQCDCSRERITRALISVGPEELKEIIAVDQQAELRCHFCNTLYHFNKEDLEDMVRALEA